MRPSVKKLPEFIETRGFEYHLLERTDYKAIYRQSLCGILVGYEILRIQVSRKGSRKKGYAFSEVFPNNEDFGLTAWTIRDTDMAWDFYRRLSGPGIQLELNFF